MSATFQFESVHLTKNAGNTQHFLSAAINRRFLPNRLLFDLLVYRL